MLVNDDAPAPPALRRLFAVSLCVIALLTKTDPGSAHEYSRFGTVESLVTRGTLQLDDSVFIVTVDKIQRDGHFYSHQLPLLAVLEAPVYWVLHGSGAAFNNRGRRVVTFAFTLLTNGVALALTIVIVASLLGLAGMRVSRRRWYAVVLVCGTWLLPYGIVSNNHGIAGLLLAALIYVLFVIEWRGITMSRASMAGALLGLLVAIELLPLVSFLPVTVVYLAWRRIPRRAWITFLAALAVPLAAHALINMRVTGDPIPAGFHVELFQYPGSVFDGTSLTGSLKYDALSSAAEYAWAVLFAGRGFFTFAPLLLFSLVVGLLEWRWWKRARALHLLLLAGIASSFAAALLTTNNYGGEAVGFRHAVYLAPAFLALLLPWLVERNAHRQRTAVATVATLSMTLMIAFAVRAPWSVLSVTNAPIGGWADYLPIVARLVRGDLLQP